VRTNPKILVLRFSALGDVAMTVPVIWSLRKQFPHCDIVFVSRPFAQDLLGPLAGVEFLPVDFNGRHKGLMGLFRLYKSLRAQGPWTFVADLHGVLRTKILSFLFRFSGTKVVVIDKGREEKNALCRKNQKVFAPLKSTIDRYREVFERGGMSFGFSDFPGQELYDSKRALLPAALDRAGNKVGIAPFAKHPWKMWPQEKMRRLMTLLEKDGAQVFLFGSRGAEKDQLDQWAAGRDTVHNLAGTLSMENELQVMARLDVMVSMDSANMHLASLVGTPVVSIWGATHPYAGFYGWGQDPDDAVQVALDCRPCSVFGNVTCHRGDFACMNRVSESMVLEKIHQVLHRKS
jgi:ADP-heptose:LPS heptosyltransferase